MDKVINGHIDKIEELEQEFFNDLDSILKDLDIKKVMADPEGEMLKVKNDIMELYYDKYAEKAVELGISFGEMINKKIEAEKTIKVDDSDDPKLND